MLELASEVSELALEALELVLEVTVERVEVLRGGQSPVSMGTDILEPRKTVVFRDKTVQP